MSEMLVQNDGPLAIFIDGIDVIMVEGTQDGEQGQVIAGLLRTLQRSIPAARVIATCRQEVWFDPQFSIHHIGQAYYLRLLRIRDIALAIQRWWNVKEQTR